MTKRLRNKRVKLANIRFGRPTSPQWSFSVFISFRYKGEDSTEIHMEKDITSLYVKYFGKVTSERTKKALLRAVPDDGFLADFIYPETETVCFGQGKRIYFISLAKGELDPWLKKASNLYL